MALVNMKQANKTVLLISTLVAVLVGSLVFEVFWGEPGEHIFLTALGAGITLIVMATILTIETLFEGKFPSFRKASVWINILFAGLGAIFGIVLIAKGTITTPWQMTYGVVLVIDLALLIREMIWA